MLITCPDCRLQVSDKARSCPHCGFPLKEEVSPARRKKRRMRLPNGFGQISEIKNANLREPFRVMVTVGYDEDTGRPICRLLKPKSYFRTYNEAYEALLEYHKTPYEKAKDKTMNELYEEWFEKYQTKVVEATWKQTPTIWSKASAIHNIKVSDLRVLDIKEMLNVAENSPITQRKVKNVVNLILDYAVENEIVSENISRKFSIDSKKKDEEAHIRFSDAELKILLQNISDDYVAYIVIGCYTGWRPDELLNIKLSDIQDGLMTGGIKTAAGKNRVVPVHPVILPLVQRFQAEHAEYLCEESGKRISYRKYHDRFAHVMAEFALDGRHKPHDTRVTFVTKLKEAGADEYAIKRMAGHAISDVTEKYYTKRGPDWLREEVLKINIP